MKNRQRGIALGQLIVWGFLLALVAIMGMKTVPSIIEYYTILKNVKTIANQAGQETTVQELRVAFVRYAEIDAITSVTHNDLDIYKDGGRVVIAFAYEKKVPLFGPVSLVIDYEGSATGGR
jgi:hypothetical protein